MHRSASTTRASDEFHLGMGTPPSGAGGKGAAEPGGGESAGSHLLLPRFDPQPDWGKKEAARARSAKGAVHLIPILLIACALVLWLFSSPPQIEVTIRGDSMVAKMDDMTIVQSYGNSSLPREEDPTATEHSTTAEEVNDESMMYSSPKQPDQY